MSEKITKPLFVMLDADVKAALDEKAWSLHKSTAEYIRDLITAALSPALPQPETQQ